ncbi:MAG TPA: DUF2116 family Zn-ribbon domain-containing protein [Methanospirillum sp.]|nr:DUF2116 family Zn-ribbon domain-containing protein [Methanospirillum sp.]
MEQVRQCEQTKRHPCLWCGDPIDVGQSYCSELCMEKFYKWIESEHASMRGVRPQYWNKIRRYVLERDEKRCQICGDGTDLSVHHIIPLSQGGDSTYGNLRVLCYICHQKAHGKPEPKKKIKKTRIRIKYQPLFIPAILGYEWLWKEKHGIEFSN